MLVKDVNKIFLKEFGTCNLFCSDSGLQESDML